VEAIEDNRWRHWIGCPCEVVRAEQDLITECEEGIFAEVAHRAERVFSLLPSLSVGIGLVTWYVTPPEAPFQLACALAAFAAIVNEKPTTVALAVHPDEYEDVARMADFCYGSGQRLGLTPPLFSLNERQGLDTILRNVVQQHALRTVF
jgi:hypothetical protein